MPRVRRLLRGASRLQRSERAQDSFEYVPVVGGISVAMILAIASPVGNSLAQAVIFGACNAVGLVVPAPVCS